MHLKALLGNGFLDPVGGIENLLVLCVFQPSHEQKLPGRGHLHLDMVQMIDISFDDLPHLGIVFLGQPAGQVRFVIVKAFRGVGAGDLNVRNGREHHHQVTNLDLNIRMGKHRNIGGCYEIKEQLIFAHCKSVLGKGSDAEKLLHRAALFLFLLFFCHGFTSIRNTVVC